MSILSILLGITVYSALIFCFIMLFKKLFGKHISPSLHYFIWLLLVLRLIMPVTIDSGFRLFTIPAENVPVSENAQIPMTDTVNTDIYTPDESISQTPDSAVADFSRQPNGIPQTSVSAEPAAMKPFNWSALLLYVWITGAALSIAYLVWSYLYLKKRIRKSAVSPDKELADIFRQCVRELGIKRNIRMVLQSEISSPALLVFPVMLIPADIMQTMDKQQIAFAVKHELVHYKRKDHIVCLLLSLLQAVYWFNPFVWLAYRQIRMDMETACDSMVVKTMDGDERLKYAATVLSLFSRKKQLPVVLGMAVVNTKKTAEKRLKGIYMKQKSNRKGRLSAAMLACVMVITCFTTACQPTPEEAIVVGKDSENMLDMAQQSNVPADTEISIKEAVNIPDHYTCDLQSESGLVTLAADAQVTAPDVTAIPVTRVKMRGFTQEETDKLIEVLMRGNPIYESPKTTVYTKEQLNERIIEARRMLSSGEYQGLTKEDIEEKINWYEERMLDAPKTLEDADLTLSDGKLKYDEESGSEDYETLIVLANLDKASFATLSINNAYAHKSFDVYFTSGWNWNGQLEAAKLTLSQQAAQQQAEAFLAEMGYEDMSLINCFKDSMKALAHETWVLDYASQINGISVSTETDHANAMSSAEGEEAQAYAPTWEAERLRITIDDEGIQDIQWCSPYDVVEEVTDNASLKSFEEIKQRFEEMFFVKNSDAVLFDKGKTYDVRFVVDSVKLGLMRVNEKDSPDTGLIVPVWFFHGYEANMLEAELEARGLTEMPDNAGMVLMKINAIDGSIIE